MCATTKYVSVNCQLTGKTARKMPVIPPIRNVPIPPTAYSSATRNSIVPRHNVAIQLKIFTPVGTAITKLESMKKASTTVALGVANMWCAQTSMPRKAMAAVAAAIAL